MNIWDNRKNFGFTLIELLVVIAVIGLLASVVMVALNSARAKARDAKRLTDMKQLSTALALYYDKFGDYPDQDDVYGEGESQPALGGRTCGMWDSSNIDNNNNGISFLDPLVLDGIMSKVPGDPIGGTVCYTNTYRYFRYLPGDWGCDASKGSYYVLGISDLETDWAKQQNPGFSCSGRNWSVEFPAGSGLKFDWVIGQFER